MAVALSSPAAVRLFAGAALVVGLAYSSRTYAQTRPVPPIGPPIVNPPIEPPIIRPPIEPPIQPPVLPPIATPDARIVTEPGIVVGTIGRASVELPSSSTSTTSTGRSTTATLPTAYRWTILNGRLLSDPGEPVAEFTSTTAGNVTLGVSVTADGVSYSTSTRVVAMPATIAGAMTAPSSVTASNATAVAASVPPAVNSDRTFRWSVSDDARIVRGQNTAAIGFTPGSPGVKEVTCAVTLQNIGTVTLRSFVEVTGTGAIVPVTISEGSGGGGYPAGSRIAVLADPPPRGTVFDRWVGETAALGADPLAAWLPQATLTVPSEPITLTATYRPAPVWSPLPLVDATPRAASDRAAAAPARTLYYLPEGARGLVFLLHDTAGSAADWFERPDQVLLTRDLVAAGFGVAAITSSNRTWATQTTFAGNPDVLSVASVWEKLTADGGFSPTKPLFIVGVGTGAQAAARFADLLKESQLGLPVHGVVLLCGTGSEDLAAVSTVPAFFAVASRDVSSGTSGAAAARANADVLAGRGIAAQVLETRITPVPPRRLLKIAAVDAGFTVAEAMETWTALRTADVLDTSGYVKQVLSADAIRAALPSTVQRYAADVAAELQLAAGARGVPSELAPRVIDFLVQRAAGVAGREPGRITNLSTRSRVAYVGDSFALGFVLSGSERAQLLVRAIGPGLARFGIAGRCLAASVELYRGNSLVAANAGWDANRNEAARISAAGNAVGAFPLIAGAADAALLASVPAGSYQLIVRGVNGTTGDVLAEVFDVTRNSTRLIRISASSRIDDASSETVVTGFVVEGGAARTLLFRGIGPGLVQLGRPADAVMADPAMVVADAAGARVAANDNWGDNDVLRLIAIRSGVAPLSVGSRDAALITAVQPGSYTIEAAAAGSSTPAGGELMIEVTEVP